MALTVIAGMILPGAGTAEAASQLQVAQYIKTTRGTVAGTAASNHGTYAGQWKASIPMADVMSAFESKMKSEADAGHFPWNIEKVDSSAYIYYDVTFPEGVSVGMPVTASKTNIVPAHTITNSKSGNTVKFKFKLADVNWKTIYDYYKADRASGTSNHTVDVTVPYTVKANSYKEAQDLEAKTIDSSGSFSFYPSQRMGKWGFGKQTFSSDQSRQPLAVDFASSDVFTKPTVSNMRQTVNIDADLRLGDNTGNNTITVQKSDSMDFVGVIHAKTIKDQMAQIESSYAAQADRISLSNLTTSFTARIALPDALTFASTEATLEGANGSFQITGVHADDHSAEVTFKLVHDDKIDTFAKLREAVDKVDDELKVTLKTAKFNASAQGNTDYEITGGMTGSLVATATNQDSGSQINFHLIWNGKQTEGGKSTSNPSQIALSVRYQGAMEQTYQTDLKLPGDILVGNETEHSQVYEAAEKSKIAFTGALDVSPVKNQLQQVEDRFRRSNVDPTTIALSEYSSVFTASLVLPDELDFDGTPEVSLLNANGKYRIVSRQLDGKTMTVTMTVNKNVATFADLKDAVLGMDDQLKVLVNGAVFNSQARPDTNYTVKGSMSGWLKAKATDQNSGSSVNFNLGWQAEQSAEGADAIHPTSKDISFTLKYKARPTEQTITGSDVMDGDLLVNGDTQHDKVYEAGRSDTMKITGRLDVTKIKERMKQLEDQYDGDNIPENIAVSNLETSFTAVLELPDQLAYRQNLQISLRRANDKFKITSTRVDGNKLTVVMTLKKQANSFKEIKEAVEGVDNQLDVVVDGVVFRDSAEADTNYRIKGTVSGSFKARATNQVSGNILHFDYTWNAKQLDGGQDYTAPASEEISLTVKYRETPSPKPHQPNVRPNQPAQPGQPNVRPNQPAEPGQPNIRPNRPAERNRSSALAKKTKTAPKTGDRTQLLVYVSIMVGAFVIGLVAFGKRKRAGK